MCTRAFAGALIMLTLARPAAAQTDSFLTLPLRINLGDALIVVDDSGARIRGRLVGLTPTAIVLRTDAQPRLLLPAARIREVTKRGRDPLGNGALIGLGSGAAIGLAGGLTVWHNTGRSPAPYVVLLGGAFAGIGTLVDAAIRHDAVVFRASTVAVSPLIDATRRGIGVVVRW